MNECKLWAKYELIQFNIKVWTGFLNVNFQFIIFHFLRVNVRMETPPLFLTCLENMKSWCWYLSSILSWLNWHSCEDRLKTTVAVFSDFIWNLPCPLTLVGAQYSNISLLLNNLDRPDTQLYHRNLNSYLHYKNTKLL